MLGDSTMTKQNRSTIATALLLILLGSWFLAIQISPAVKSFAHGQDTWPFNILIAGGLLFVLALATWTPGMMIPASIVSGIGGILYYQNANNAFGTWSFAWALIPGFVGIGILLAGIMEAGRNRGELTSGAILILISAIAFGIFGSFLGGKQLLLSYWPVALILLGLVFLIQSLFRLRRPQI
jgi:membrane protein YdbS with pleckstrin-like domain